MSKIESNPEELSIIRLPRNSEDDYQNEWQLRKAGKILRIHSLDIELIEKLCRELREESGLAIQAGTPEPDFAFMDKEETWKSLSGHTRGSLHV